MGLADQGGKIMDESIKRAILAELKSAQDIADVVVKENRSLSGEEQGRVKSHFDRATELRKQATDQEELRRQISDLGSGIGVGFEPGEKSQANAPERYSSLPRFKSLGSGFVESEQYRAMLKGAPGGHFGDLTEVRCQPWGVKALLKQGGGGGGGGSEVVSSTGDESAGALITPQQSGILDAFYQTPLTVRQLVTPGRTGTDAIEYVRVTETTNRAAPVPEATKTGRIQTSTPADPDVDVTDAEGGLKPKSSVNLTKETANVKTIAHWTPATKRSLADAPQVQTLIDAFLRWGLEEALEAEIVSGDGTDEHFVGLEHVSGTGSQDGPGSGETILDVCRKARTQVQLNGRTAPTAYLLNPIDWQSIDLMKDAQERYLGAGPFALTPNTLWGLPVVQSEAIPEGTGWVADWKKAVLWDREQASVSISTSHEDWFTRNLVAILAEMRAAFGVIRPAAFVKIALT
jgi:HK97 family phage major capsid protein